MVDRITPTVTKDIARHLNSENGLNDDLPVVAEDFHQWVLEDSFADGRPPLEQAGVQFVSDVTDYEHVKIRMLNAAHIMLSFPAILMGYACRSRHWRSTAQEEYRKISYTGCYTNAHGTSWNKFARLHGKCHQPLF